MLKRLPNVMSVMLSPSSAAMRGRLTPDNSARRSCDSRFARLADDRLSDGGEGCLFHIIYNMGNFTILYHRLVRISRFSSNERQKVY